VGVVGQKRAPGLTCERRRENRPDVGIKAGQ
jgi:hypothetical protein